MFLDVKPYFTGEKQGSKGYVFKEDIVVNLLYWM